MDREGPFFGLRQPHRAFPAGSDPGTGPVSERLRVREIDDDEDSGASVRELPLFVARGGGRGCHRSQLRTFRVRVKDAMSGVFIRK